jgi:hypothetical protein
MILDLGFVISNLFQDRKLKIANQTYALDALTLAALFLASFALYARTVAPTVLDADGGEFQTNIYRLGVSHTGYPLYFILAKIWTLLVPFGSVAYRANLFSSFFGALTLALLYVTMRVVVSSRRASFFTAALFAVSRVEWSQALIPDVYTLNSFFIVLIVLLAALWRAQRVPLTWLVFAYGLSLTHHRTMIWIAPALAIFILLGEGRKLFQPKRMAALVVALVLPLLLYVYIPLRGESDVGVEYHAKDFAQMILASNASVWLRVGPPGFIWERITQVYLPLLIEQFTPLGFAFGLFGIYALARPSPLTPHQLPRDWLLFLLLAHLGETAFAIVFWVLDSEIFFIPSYLTFLIFIGIGIAFVADFAREKKWTRLTLSALAATFGACILYLAFANFPRVDLSARGDVQARWDEIFAQPLEKGAMLAGNWESLTPLEYYQYVEQRRVDLQRTKVIIYQDQLKLAPQENAVKEISQMVNAGTPVYLTLHPSETETLGALTARFALTPIASLWRVERQTPEFKTDVDASLGEALTLTAVALNSAAPRAGDFVHAIFFWRAEQPLDAAYTFSLRLRDPEDGLWMQRDFPPFGGIKPTTEWATRQEIRDPEGFFVPPDLPPGEYALDLVVYDAVTHAPLLVNNQPTLKVATLHIAPGGYALPREVYAIPHWLNSADANENLVGYGLSGEVRAGARVELATWWKGLTQNRAVDIGITDARGNATALYVGPLFQNFTAAQLDPRQIVRARHTLAIPPSLAPGRAELFIADARAELNTVTAAEKISVAQVEVLPSNRQFAAPRVEYATKVRLGDSIQLIGYDVSRASLHPGDDVGVTLHWHATQTSNVSYTVFVHLLDANGFLRAQHDAIPRNGASPTDQWLAGEYVDDAHTLTLPNNFAPGEYRVEVGLYDAATGARLPAFDANGARLPDDRVLLDTIAQVVK